MKRWKTATVALLLCLTGLLWVQSQPAYADAVVGTWSGSWRPMGRSESATVLFFLEGDTVAGKMVNPESVEFTSISFDRETMTLMAGGDGVSLQVRIANGTRLNGTLSVGDVTGAVRLTPVLQLAPRMKSF